MLSYSVLAVILLEVPVSVVLAVDPHPHCSPGDCGEGEKKGTDGRCIPCDTGTFMNFRGHSCTSCYPCDNATHEGEIIIVNCTDRSNAIVSCKPGYFNAYGSSPDDRSCLKCKECSDIEYISRKCTVADNTLCIPNTTPSKVVPEDKDGTTSVRNDLPTTETTNSVNETTVSPASNFSTTAPPEAGGDSSNEVLKIVLIGFACVVFVVVTAAVGVYIYRKRRRTGLLAIKPQQVNSDDIELSDNNTV